MLAFLPLSERRRWGYCLISLESKEEKSPSLPWVIDRAFGRVPTNGSFQNPQCAEEGGGCDWWAKRNRSQWHYPGWCRAPGSVQTGTHHPQRALDLLLLQPTSTQAECPVWAVIAEKAYGQLQWLVLLGGTQHGPSQGSRDRPHTVTSGASRCPLVQQGPREP